MTRMMAPEMKPGGREDATPRYGNGNVNKKTDIGTETVDARQDSTAEEILSRCNNDIL